jgi:hypothetical protein
MASSPLGSDGTLSEIDPSSGAVQTQAAGLEDVGLAVA